MPPETLEQAVYDIDDPDLQLLDTNTRKTGDIVTLDYQLREYFRNPYATRVESVTPFLITQYFGTVKLTPSSDLWVDQKRVKTTKIEVEGDYSATIKKLGINEQTGLEKLPGDLGKKPLLVELKRRIKHPQKL